MASNVVNYVTRAAETNAVMMPPASGPPSSRHASPIPSRQALAASSRVKNKRSSTIQKPTEVQREVNGSPLHGTPHRGLLDDTQLEESSDENVTMDGNEHVIRLPPHPNPDLLQYAPEPRHYDLEHAQHNSNHLQRIGPVAPYGAVQKPYLSKKKPQPEQVPNIYGQHAQVLGYQEPRKNPHTVGRFSPARGGFANEQPSTAYRSNADPVPLDDDNESAYRPYAQQGQQGFSETREEQYSAVNTANDEVQQNGLVHDSDFNANASASPTRSRSLTPKPHKPPREKKRSAPATDLDYERATLFAMEYSTLAAQSFEEVPESKKSKKSNKSSVEGNLHSRLELGRSLGPKNQAELFAAMPSAEWEESGKWFVDRFSDIMKKMIDARTAKREISREFEEELEHHQQAIESLSTELRKDMEGMRSQGSQMLSTPRGKPAA